MRITQLLALALKLNHHHVQNSPYSVASGRGKLDYHVDEYAAGYLPTIGKSGSNQVIQSMNSLSNVRNQSRGTVLAEPFPWTVTQGVIPVFVIINSQL